MRKHQQRMSTLLVVVGSLCLVIGGIFALSAFAQYEYQRGKFFRLASYFAIAGLASLVIRFFFISLPDILADRKSAVAARRRELAQTYQRPKPGPPAIPPADEGSILILVLVLMGIISGVALQAIVSARSAQDEASATLRNGLLRTAVIDTARSAMQQLADDSDLNIDSAEDEWAGYREFVDPAGTTRTIRISDLQQSFDLNNITVKQTGNVVPASEVLSRIMVGCGVYTPGLKVMALTDWTDEDASGSYEADFYQKKAPPYLPADRILAGWDELLHVDGWIPEMFAAKPPRLNAGVFDGNLSACVSIIPAARNRIIPVNINTANATVLQALFGYGSEGVVDRVMKSRKDLPLADTQFLAELLGEDAYDRILPYLDVKSRYFMIRAGCYADGVSARMELLAARAEDGSVSVVKASFL